MLLVVLVFSAAFFLYSYREVIENLFSGPGKNQTIMELWESRDYSGLIDFCNKVLEENPSDFEALVFLGFASFYKGTAVFDQDRKMSYMDDAVLSLRKAVLFDSEKLNPQINYILGKAYLHKGKFYSDLSVKYLNMALEDNYLGADIYEYLGLAYSELGFTEHSARYFEKAAEKNPSDLLLLVLAQIYMDNEDFQSAEKHLIKSNSMTEDNRIRERNLFMLARIYEKKEDYKTAEETYREIISSNPESADAHYHLGLLYETMGDNIRARAELRRALRIDPDHYGTRLKLF